MNALDRLKEKIDTWKARIRELEGETARLREEKEALSKELEACKEGGSKELENLRGTLEEKEATIVALRKELETKDAEIEAIIAKVEALLE
ncbi:hypothetical protein [Nitratifractor sp.]